MPQVRARRVAILALSPWHELGQHVPFSYGARRIQAALLADPRLEGVEVRLFDVGARGLDGWLEELAAFDPDVVGASAYVWSMPTFALVARGYKAIRPDAMVVLGGPSARSSMLELAPYAGCAPFIDALVVDHGERAIGDLVAAWPATTADLEGIASLEIPTPSGWRRTAPDPDPPLLNDLPSPYRMGLAPRGSTAYLETFRGCPMSCSFCQWGSMDPAQGVLSVETLVDEFEALKELDPQGIALVDAGLNLNAKAFRNLMEAEARTGFMRGRYFDTEFYPNTLRPRCSSSWPTRGPRSGSACRPRTTPCSTGSTGHSSGTSSPRS